MKEKQMRNDLRVIFFSSQKPIRLGREKECLSNNNYVSIIKLLFFFEAG